MSKKAGVCTLLNILTPHGQDSAKKGRGEAVKLSPSSISSSSTSIPGFLVKDFLTGSENAESYLKKISAEGDSYNGFHLVVVDHRF
jgi:uncharacterized protein with NRDE domain